MGEAPCNLLEVELQLDHVEGVLAVELPRHVEAFARAYAAGRPLPDAPDIAGRASTASIGRRALAHPELAMRGAELLHVVAPLVIERDAAVSTARGREAPSWAAYAALTALRDQVARARFGRSCREILHALHGATEPAGAEPPPPPIAGWTEPDGIDLDVERTWDALSKRFVVPGLLEIVRAGVRPRTFVVEHGAHAIAVVPRQATTPAARFAVLHELGHAVANLVSPRRWPRMLDEAMASLIARDLERTTPIAEAARVRRTQLARALAAVERGERAGESVAASPPWALWHDPMAQAAYVAAEDLADRLAAAADPRPLLDEIRVHIELATAI